MLEPKKYLTTVVFVAVFSLLMVWSPFALHPKSIWGIDFSKASMQTVIQNYDGLNFLVVARSWYNPEIIQRDYAELVDERGTRYFAAHYPMYAAMIGFYDIFVSGPDAMLLAIVTSNILLAIALWLFFKHFLGSNSKALVTTLVSLYLPARMLAVRSVGSNEPLFIALILLSLLSTLKSKHIAASVWGALAVLTRSPGILLFAGVTATLYYQLRSNWRQAMRVIAPYILIPLALVCLWAYFGLQYGDMLAYFKVGGNLNLYLPPFLVFGSHLDWVSGGWLEDVIYLYIFYTVGIGLFAERASNDRRTLVVRNFAWIYLTSLFFIAHRDIARYALPIAPVALLGYAPYLNNKYVKAGLLILIIPVTLYSWNYMLNNIQALSDWSPYL